MRLQKIFIIYHRFRGINESLKKVWKIGMFMHYDIKKCPQSNKTQ